jgi:predicted DNA-binding protein YlxM (UPF0122 family)
MRKNLGNLELFYHYIVVGIYGFPLKRKHVNVRIKGGIIMTAFDDLSIFRCLGSTPQLKVIMLFLEHPNDDFTKTEIAKYADMARQTVYVAIKPLLLYDIIRVHRQIANTKLYRLHQGEVTKLLIQLNHKLNNKW